MENPHSLGLCTESIDSYYGFCYSNMLQTLFESQLYAQICVQQKTYYDSGPSDKSLERIYKQGSRN